jgi:transcriptional regulator with XRE-family HTH domain
VQVLGKESRSYTFTEVAFGSGLSLSLISLILRGRRPVSAYAETRLAEFFGITIEQLWTPGTITVQVPPVRPLGRVIRIRRGSSGPPVVDSYAASQTVGPQSEEEWDRWLRARLPGEK